MEVDCTIPGQRGWGMDGSTNIGGLVYFHETVRWTVGPHVRGHRRANRYFAGPVATVQRAVLWQLPRR